MGSVCAAMSPALMTAMDVQWLPGIACLSASFKICTVRWRSKVALVMPLAPKALCPSTTVRVPLREWSWS
eukprot:6492497-Amphidinium_carterae.2